MKIKTTDGWYLCELRGAVFTTWVCEQDKEHAMVLEKPVADGVCEFLQNTQFEKRLKVVED